MTNPFPTQTLRQIRKATDLAIANEMILESERNAVEQDAKNALIRTGSVYICGTTVRLSLAAQDRMQAQRISAMSPATFDRFAYGL